MYTLIICIFKVFIDGFGLWEPIGHVDYFANGGQQQPGCRDLQASIVATTFGKLIKILTELKVNL